MRIYPRLKNLNWQNIVTLGGIGSALWLLLIKGYKKVIKPALQLINSVHQLISDMAEVKEKILPNGGKSLDDKAERIEKKLDLSLGRQSGIIHEIMTAMWEADSRGKIINVNRKWMQLTGLSLEEARGHESRKIIHKEDLNYVLERERIFIECGFEFEAKLRMVNYDTGKVFGVQSTATKILDRDGDIISIIGAINVIDNKI